MSTDLTEVTTESICVELARLYSGRDWHKLSSLQHKLIEDLECIGYLSKSNNGFVGNYVRYHDRDD